MATEDLQTLSDLRDAMFSLYETYDRLLPEWRDSIFGKDTVVQHEVLDCWRRIDEIVTTLKASEE